LQVSFDCDGLAILVDNSSVQYYPTLCNGNGKVLIKGIVGYSYEEMRLGDDGSVIAYYKRHIFIFKYNKKTKRLNKVSNHSIDNFNFDYDKFSSIFPDIYDRDAIPEANKYFSENDIKSKLPEPDKLNNIDKDTAAQLLNNNSVPYRYLKKFYSNDKNLAYTAISNNYIAFSLLSEELKNDRSFVYDVLQMKPLIFCFLNDEFKKDPIFLKIILGYKFGGYEYLNIRHIAPIKDKNIALDFLRISRAPEIYQFFDKALTNDKTFIIETLKINGNIYPFLKDKFQNQKSIATLAIKNSCSIEDLPERFQTDKDILSELNKLKELAKEYNEYEENESDDEYNGLPF